MENKKPCRPFGGQGGKFFVKLTLFLLPADDALDRNGPALHRHAATRVYQHVYQYAWIALVRCLLRHVDVHGSNIREDDERFGTTVKTRSEISNDGARTASPHSYLAGRRRISGAAAG